MRMLMTATLPVGPFNAAVRDGTVGAKLHRILEAIKPEAVYFTETVGIRSALLIVDIPDASKIPELPEPWFLLFEAEVTIRIAMTPEDLKKSSLEQAGKMWG